MKGPVAKSGQALPISPARNAPLLALRYSLSAHASATHRHSVARPCRSICATQQPVGHALEQGLLPDRLRRHTAPIVHDLEVLKTRSSLEKTAYLHDALAPDASARADRA